MKLFFFNVFLIFSSLVFSQKEIYVNDKIYTDDCAEIIIDTTININQISSDDFRIRKISIENDCLIISLIYYGGCSKVYFELITDNLIEESMPPQLRFFLKLTDKDFCRAGIPQELKFSLDKYKSYKDNNGLVIKILNNNKSIIYKQ